MILTKNASRFYAHPDIGPLEYAPSNKDISPGKSPGMSPQWNQQLSMYVFSKQSIRKQTDCKRPSTTKQMNLAQNIQIEIWKFKAVEFFEI